MAEGDTGEDGKSKARKRNCLPDTSQSQLLPDVKQEVGFLPESWGTAMKLHRCIVHLVPQSVTGLSKKGDELHGFSTTPQAENYIRVQQNITGPAPKETFSPRTQLPVTLPWQLLSLSPHFNFVGEEGAEVPLYNRSSVHLHSCHRCAPGRRIRSRAPVLHLPEKCMGQDLSTQGTPPPTERLGGLRNHPETCRERTFQDQGPEL